ncbi:MAG: hypothetical protein QOJ09_134, partial [Actinomycetota bacterium]|nr:hypothetical protein [Actinomycetota bacterium]
MVAAGVGLPLLADLAWKVHGPGEVDDKVAWVLDAVRGATGLRWSGLVAGEDGRDAGDAEVLGAPGLLALVTEPVALHVRAPDGLLLILGAPVVGADGTSYGVLAAAGAADDRPDDAGLDVLAGLAAHLAVALDAHAVARVREEMDASQRDAVHQLQDAVRPPIPAVPDTELGVHYLAADPATPTGGDLYDWQLLPDGDVHIAIVDVMGKGVAATKDAL